MLHDEVDSHWWEKNTDYVDCHNTSDTGRKPSLPEIRLTHIVNSPWNNYICILLGLLEGGKNLLRYKVRGFTECNTRQRCTWHDTYRQTELLKSRFHECRILTENLLQVPPSGHVSQNYSGNQVNPLILCDNIWNIAWQRETSIPLRDSRTSESVSTKSFMWNISRTVCG